MGNIINRVFDSSGPEGKVRGTPQQIIEKYNQLARDAQLSGDRVATENFQQHAEHYLRLLGEATKEQDAKREEQERQNRDRQAERDRDRGQRQERESGGSDASQDGDTQPERSQDTSQPESAQSEGRQPESQQPESQRNEAPRPDSPRARSDKSDAPPRRSSRRAAPQPDVISTDDDSDSGLVETPESQPPAKPKRQRKPRKSADEEPKGDGGGQTEAAE